MREVRSTGSTHPVSHIRGAKPKTKAEQAAEPQETFTKSHTSPQKSQHAHAHKSGHAAAAHAAGAVLGAGVGVVAILGNQRDPELKSLKKLVGEVRDVLTDDLRKPEYQGNPNPMAGHCYVASEAIYHHLGGKEAGWKPVHIQHEGGPHWFLINQEGIVVDPTADQFKTPVPYEEGVPSGFLTRQPSKRAQTVLDRMED